MEFKWIAIMFIGFAAALSIGASISDFADARKMEVAANSGLEECLAKPDRYNFTIWVKSCTEYTEQYYKNKDK